MGNLCISAIFIQFEIQLFFDSTSEEEIIFLRPMHICFNLVKNFPKRTPIILIIKSNTYHVH